MERLGIGRLLEYPGFHVGCDVFDLLAADSDSTPADEVAAMFAGLDAID